MATRFKKLRTRKVKPRHALRTRKHRGGSLASLFQKKKAPVTTANSSIATTQNDSTVMYGRKEGLNEWAAKKQKKANAAKKIRDYVALLKTKPSETIEESYKHMDNETKDRTKRLINYKNITALSNDQLLELYYLGKVRSGSV